MPATYSIFNGEIIESTRKTDILSVLQGLSNNTQKLIRPRDVRDAFLSTWSNSAFKLTTTGTDDYIGLDSNNPDNRDIKNKILLGKRSVGSLNVMSSTLLNSDTDIFFYNTKPDSGPQTTTKISFLAGTDPSLFEDAPHIKAVEVGGSSIRLDIVNEQDSINLLSISNRVSINNINFPTLNENSLVIDLNGKILKYSGIYPFGKLIWSDVEISGTSIGSIGQETNIIGSTVSLNGYNLEFIDDRLVPETVGGIVQGSSFSATSFTNYLGSQSNWPITEVLKELLYPYVPPGLELSLVNTITGNKYAEVGTTASLELDFSITLYNRNNSEIVDSYQLTVDSFPVISGGAIGGEPGDLFTFSATHSILESITNTGKDYQLDVFSGGITHSVIDSLEFISPFIACMNEVTYFFIPSELDALINDSSTKKIIEPESDSISENYSGVDSHLYFAYPSSYGELSFIKDPNGYIIYDSGDVSSHIFTYSVVTPSDYDYYGEYIIYRSNIVTYVGDGKFEFIF